MSKKTRAATGAVSLIAGLSLTLGGCSGQGRYTREAVSQAEEKMSVIKAGTEWKMGEQAFLAGDLEKALRRVDASLSLNDTVTKSHVLRGRVLLEQGDLGESLMALKTAEALDPEDADAQYYLGIVHERLSETEVAMKHYRLASERDGHNPDYAVAAAEMMIDLGMLGEAKAYLTGGPTFEHAPGVRQALGHIARIEGDPEAAVGHFAEARLLAPEDSAILEDLVRAQMAVGDFGDAESNIVRLIAKAGDEERRDLVHMRARCLTHLGRPVEARDAFRELTADAIGQNDVAAWIGLGEVSTVIRDERGLRRAASRVVALAPSRPEGYTLWAIAYRQAGDPQKALSSIERALALAPTDAAGHAFRGLVLSDLGRETDAQRAFAAAVQNDPQTAKYRTLLSHAQQGRVVGVPATTE
ncbi:MAG: tetratricopeptide repeat protein [Planctomycetota bacterium]